MTHIAFINIPAHGHVNPTLAVARGLAARGARVSYAVTKEFAPAIKSTGATLKPYRSQFDALPKVSFPITPDESAMMPLKLLDEGLHALPQLEDLYKDDRPDVVCYDFMAFAGRFFAEKLAVPAMRLWPSYAANASFSLAKRFMQVNPQHEALREYGRKLVSARAEHGLAPLTPQQFFETIEASNVVFLPRAFQYEGATFDDRFHFVGPCLRDANVDGQWQPKASADPTLFISLGTAFNNWPEFFKTCIETFGNKPWNVVMAIGSQVDRASLGPIPTNFDVRPHVPQLEVLARAHVFVSHGGMNSTMESLWHGVPLVVIPQMHEQEATARRVEELGLGCYLPRPEVDNASLARAVTQVAADERIREKVAMMRKEVREAGGVPLAIEGILNFARTSR